MKKSWNENWEQQSINIINNIKSIPSKHHVNSIHLEMLFPFT